MRRFNGGSTVPGANTAIQSARRGPSTASVWSCNRGEIDFDFGLIAVVFVAGLYFTHVGISTYYNAFGSVLGSIIR